MASTKWSDIRAQRITAEELRQIDQEIESELTRHQNETKMVASGLEAVMPTTLTLKNIPDEVYKRLKASAEAHRRSLNSEAIVCLESVLLPERVEPGERLARARALRATLPAGKFKAQEIDAFKREGRS